MSAISAYLTTDNFVILSDTLIFSHNKDKQKNQPLSFGSKVFLLPTLDCCCVTMGYYNFAVDFKNFSEGIMASTFDSFVNIAKEDLIKSLDMNRYRDGSMGDQGGLLGTVLVTGFSEVDRKLKAYHFHAYKDHLDFEELDTDGTQAMHPAVKNVDEIIQDLRDKEVPAGLPFTIGLTREVMLQQHREYNYRKSENVVAVGGDIILTLVSLNFDCDGCVISTQKIHRFDDYNDCLDEIQLRKKIDRMEKILSLTDEDLEKLSKELDVDLNETIKAQLIAEK